MRQNPSFTLASEEGVKRLIREHPWATIVSMTDGAGLVASHYPVLLDETADGIVLLTHVGRPDEEVAGIAEDAYPRLLAALGVVTDQ